MTVTDIRTDPDNLSMTLDAEFDAPVERVWQLWADPRQLERWWGPPTYPATMTSHDLRPGGRVTYHMTGPAGDEFHGYWEVQEVDAPHGLVVHDGFAHPDGTPNHDLPRTRMRLTITEVGDGRTRMTIESNFPDQASMEQVLTMGMEEGIRGAVGQIDAILAADHASTRTLDVPGASLAWDVRPNDQSTEPILLMVGYPMGAAGFATQAGHFTDRTVVTYDPRGIERSTVETSDGASGRGSELSPVEQNVEDLHAVIEAMNAEFHGRPIEVFASSGGAVTALALVSSYPDDLATVVAHEPPLLAVLEDREAAEAAWLAVHETYMSRGGGAGMAHFIAMTMHEGPFPDDWASQPGPDPAMFGMPGDDDGSRDDPLLSQDDRGVPNHQLDVEAIAAAPTRIVIAAGVETGTTMTARTSAGVAARLGTELVMFPSDHGGFLGGEYGQVGKPDEFAATLREVLDGE